MKNKINLNLNNYLGFGYQDPHLKVSKFPDGQTHIEIIDLTISQSMLIDVTVSLDSAEKIMLLLQLVNALAHSEAILNQLTILYFYGARSDRNMSQSKLDSIDANVTLQLIHRLGFKSVEILDLHNPSILNGFNSFKSYTIDFSKIINTSNMLRIIPDKGASNKYMHMPNMGVVQFDKKRIEQKIITTSNDLEKTKEQDCYIIDDLIDGGGTFIEIAKQVKPMCKQLILICTHAIFSRGIDELCSYYDKIYVTDSFTKIKTLPKHPQIFIYELT